MLRSSVAAAAVIVVATFAAPASAIGVDAEDIVFTPEITIDNGLRFSAVVEVESGIDELRVISRNDIVSLAFNVDAPLTDGQTVSLQATDDPDFLDDDGFASLLLRDNVLFTDGQSLFLDSGSAAPGEALIQFEISQFGPNFVLPDGSILGDEPTDRLIIALAKGSVNIFTVVLSDGSTPIPTFFSQAQLTPDDTFVLATRDLSAVPLPPAAPLLASALGLLAWRRRRYAPRRRQIRVWETSRHDIHFAARRLRRRRARA